MKIANVISFFIIAAKVCPILACFVTNIDLYNKFIFLEIIFAVLTNLLCY